ncbi:MAG TPA: hypothetical protein VEZ15_04035 [Acidimicrobiia bacterium]|nr:hypothetical protein [Acidimicrobiia bacterium]
MPVPERTSQERVPGSALRDPLHLGELLRRSSGAYVELIPQLHDCEQRIAQLIGDRATRPWNDSEHGAYLRLRHREQQLRRRVQRARRVFDRVRIRLRDLQHPQ